VIETSGDTVDADGLCWCRVAVSEAIAQPRLQTVSIDEGIEALSAIAGTG
jgi:hypothetical protein